MACEDHHSCLAELSVSGRHLHWSKEVFATKFNESYKFISEADHVRVGAVELFPELYAGRRWLHWEASAGRVCLREVWLDQDLVDHSICLQLGGVHMGSPSSVHLECISAHLGEECCAVRACFVMVDGSVHNIMLEADDQDQSFLARLVDIKEASLVESVDSDSILASRHCLIRTHQLSDAALNGQSVISSCFLSHFAIVFGLSDGDVAYLRMASESDGVFVETVMRYAGVVQTLWSGIMGPPAGGITPKVLVISGSHLRDSSIALAYTADGCLSVWDCLSRRCLQKVSVIELLNLGSATRGGVSVENVKIDTCPIDTAGTYCLGIVLSVSSRCGREREWSNVIMSWAPSRPKELQRRGHLVTPSFNSKSLQSTKVTLEQISLSPCGAGSRSGHGDTIASLWKIGTEVIPVAYYLTSDVFRWTPPARGGDTISSISAHFVSLGPAEKHSHWRQGDQVFDQAVISSFSTGIYDPVHSQVYRWNAMGESIMSSGSTSSVNVEIDMHYVRTTFLQRLFSPGRFPFQVIARVITQDVPYDVQQLCSEEDDGGYDGLIDLLLARGMDTTIDEKEDNVSGFALENLGDVTRGSANDSAFRSPMVESPLEILVKAVIDVCSKYEELVLDRLVQESYEDGDVTNQNARLFNKPKKYHQQAPNLSLKAQVEVCQHILQLCEDRLCQLRSRANSCSLLVHTRGGRNTSSSRNIVETPFEFVVVRPSALGVVVSTTLVVDSQKQAIPNYAEEQLYELNDVSTFVPFSFSNILTDKQRLVGLVSVEMAQQAKGFALLDALLSRYVADVCFFGSSQSRTEGNDMEEEESSTSPSLSSTVQFLFSQAIKMSDQCLGDIYECYVQSQDPEILFDDLLQMPCVAFTSVDEERNFASNNNPMCSFTGAELLYDLSIVTTRSACVYYQAVACVFLGLLQMCEGDVKDLIATKYLPDSLNIVAHYSFIHWSESVQMSASRQLEQQVDFRDLSYNSSVINSIKKFLPDHDNRLLMPFSNRDIVDCSTGTNVLLSFWLQFSSRLTFSSKKSRSGAKLFWSPLAQRCLFALRPSSHSDYMSYLLDMGQHCLATKASSLAVLGDVQPLGDIDPGNLMQYFSNIHTLAMQRIAGVQMYLHDIASAVVGGLSNASHRTAAEVRLDTSNMIEIKQTVTLLIDLVDIPSVEIPFCENEWSCHAASRICYYSREAKGYSLQENLLSGDDIKDFVLGWTQNCKRDVLDSDDLGDSLYVSQERDEWLLCMSEAFMKLAETPYFRVFYSAISLMIREKEEESGCDCNLEVLTIVLQSYPDLLMQLHCVYLAVNCHSVVDRSRSLLPLHFGVEMALRSGRNAVNVVEHVIRTFTNLFNDWNCSEDTSSCRLIDLALHYIRKELEIVLSSLYSSILDLSLLSCLFDEGYSAVSKLIELYHQSTARDEFWSLKTQGNVSDVKEGDEEMSTEEIDEVEDEAMKLHWHGYLRSLVVKACSCGQLQWVCERPDLLVVSYQCLGENGEYEVENEIDIVKEIVNQLEFVCNSSGFTDYFSGNDVAVDSGSGISSLHLLAMYDCLAAFLLSKGLRQECARVMYQLVCRLDDELVAEAEMDDFDPLRVLEPQSRALGVAIGALNHEDVKVSQRFITMRDYNSTRQDDDGDFGDNALLYVTVTDMEHLYLQVESKISLVKAVRSSGRPLLPLRMTDEQLVVGMCSQGNFLDAINLGISAANHPCKDCDPGTPSSSRSPCLEKAISLLAEACSSESSPPGLDVIFQFSSSLGISLTSFLEFEESCNSHVFLREYLVNCLRCLDDRTSNWSLHSATVHSVLKNSTKEALGASFEDSFCGFASASQEANSNNSVSEMTGNISAYILQLLRKGYLSESCDVAKRLLDRVDPSFGQRDFIPFLVIDRVLDACSQVETIHNARGSATHTANKKQIDALSVSREKLESALSNYFKKLLVLEAGGRV